MRPYDSIGTRIRIPLFFVLNMAPIFTILYSLYNLDWRPIAVYLLVGLTLLIPERFFFSGKDSGGQYNWMERSNSKFFSVKAVYHEELTKKSKNGNSPPYIFVFIPHGFIPMGMCMYPYFSKIFGGKPLRVASATVLHTIPIITTLFKWVGGIVVTRKSLTSALKKEFSIGVILDGIAGIFSCTPTTEEARIKSRFGLIKIAIEQNIPIVPVYMFGHSQTFWTWMDPLGVMEILSRRSGFPIIAFLPFPRRVPLLHVFGEPLFPENYIDGDNVSKNKMYKDSELEGKSAKQQQVFRMQRSMLSSFKDIFDTHKAAYGWGKKEIIFV